MSDYWADLPTELRDSITDLGRRYHGFIAGIEQNGTISDHQTAVEFLELQRIEIDVIDAHNAWLARLKAKVEARGREWTRAEFLRLVRLREHE
jgi:hypothetical protein